jgi:hypothetical protein
MLSEAEEAGLRTLTIITNRFRALANSAGPLHDSRSGPGAQYRYQPRNIRAWVHPPDLDLITAGPDLTDESGRQKGLLTKVRVSQKCSARIADGTDG